MRTHTLASGLGWSVSDVVCTSGPHDRPFEEQHPAVCIAAVMQGSFQYRTTQGAATLAPGAILLGNHRHCFECGHDHAIGDRCLSFMFDPGLFETTLAAIPGVRAASFTMPRLPPMMALTPVLAAAELACSEDEPGAWEEIALDLVGKVMSIVAENRHSPSTPTRRDEKRIATVLHRIEAEADQVLSLADLARDAAMSPYHFLRTFRHVVGMTPHRFILRTRLRNAAVHLRR
ncbi:MAG: AraC family transcriptional regulator, partial [Rhodopila sp.]|nr:AraC family transcriptional regulator [Rhodopila sp.]